MIKKSSGWTVQDEIFSNKKLEEELQQPNYQKIWEKKFRLIFYKENLERRSSRYPIDKWFNKGFDKTFNKGFRFLLLFLLLTFIANIHGLFL